MPDQVRHDEKGMSQLYFQAIAALAAPASGRISQRLKPASRHQDVKSAPVKSKASPNSISMFSDIIRPNAFSRRASSMMFSIATKAPPSGRARKALAISI